MTTDNTNGTNGTAAVGASGATGAKKEYPLLPNGRYKARPIGTELGERKSDNEPQVMVEFQILEGELAGRRKTWFGGIKGGGAEYTKKAMLALGWDGDVKKIVSWKASKEVEIVIEQRKVEATPKYPNARTFDDIKYINSLDGTGVSSGLSKLALKPEDKQAAADAIAARFASLGDADAPAGEAPNSFGAGAPKGDDEIPF